MPSARAAPEIDPDAWIASSSAILPGPMRSPLVKSRRILRRVSGMGPQRRKRVEPEHREPAVFVKSRGRAVPPISGPTRSLLHYQQPLGRGARAAYFIIYNGAGECQPPGVSAVAENSDPSTSELDD